GFTHKRAFFWGGLVSVLGVGVVILATIGAMRPGHKTEASAADVSHHEQESNGEGTISVKTIRPKLNRQEFMRSVSQPAFVKGFFQADLMAHVAGPVKFIQKNIGDTVTEGEVLLELDVPDLVQEVAQKEALVKLAEQDYRAAEANIAIVVATEKE